MASSPKGLGMSTLREGINKPKSKKRKPRVHESASLQAEAHAKEAAAAAVATMTAKRGAREIVPSSSDLGVVDEESKGSRPKLGPSSNKRWSTKGLVKRIEHLTAKKELVYLSKVEDRMNRRARRAQRREEGEDDVSEDSENDEIDKYMGLRKEERRARMTNECRAQLREEEIRRLLQKDKKGRNDLQNLMIKQANAASANLDRRRQAVLERVEEIDALKSELVILEALPCVVTTMEMCLIGYKEAMRFLARDDISQQFERASLLQCKMSVRLMFNERKSPIQVKVEMLWRFAVVMHDFMHGSKQREKYLLLTLHAYNLLNEQIVREVKRRRRVRSRGSDEEKARLAEPAAWEEDQPDLFWEMGAVLASLEQRREDDDVESLTKRITKANDITGLFRLQSQPVVVKFPPPVLPPE